MGRMIWIHCWVMLVTIGGLNGYPLEDLIVRLPGQPKVGFRQFAGYIDVDPKAGRSLFYYFVEADQDPHHKPLTLWLNGGPGCSSLGGGAFTELGPFFPTGDGRGLRRNSKSWNKVSNLLFVESPAGVGWSYSNTSDYNTGDASTANDMHMFMIKWFEKFPALKLRDLFLTGESYAGHYIPQLAVTLLDHNARSTALKFNLKGVAIGNPLLSLDQDIRAEYVFQWSHGMISDEIGLTINKECDFNDYSFGTPDHNVSEKCNDAMAEATLSVGNYVDNYDVIIDVCYPSIMQQELRLRKMVTKMNLGVDVCINSECQLYLNLPEVQRALHANRTKLPYDWSMCSDVLNYSSTDVKLNMLPLLKTIIQNGVPVWVFSGDQDSVVPLLGTRTMIRELARELNYKISVPYGAWFHNGQTGGWAIEYGNKLSYATVRGAGHMVPYSQPARALHLFSSFVRGKRLPNTTSVNID